VANLEQVRSQLTTDKRELENGMSALRSSLGDAQTVHDTLVISQQQQLDRLAVHIANTKARESLLGRVRLMFVMWTMTTKADVIARRASTGTADLRDQADRCSPTSRAVQTQYKSH